MATTVDELLVRIKADTKQLESALNRTKNQTKDTTKGVGGLGAALKRLGPIIATTTAAFAAFRIGKGIADTGDQFEALRISLDKLAGGQEQGAAFFEEIKVFAETTPFQLEDVTKAFIALKSNGIEPNERMMTAFGDAASIAMNPLEAFNAMVRITQRAAGGGLGLVELEQIATQGIPVFTILEKEIGKTRLELSELGKTSEGANIIMQGLIDGLEREFGGIMQERMGLLSTEISNLQIAFKNLQNTIFTGGLGEILKGVAADIREAINRINSAILEGRAEEELEQLPERVRLALLQEARDRGEATITGGQMSRSTRRDIRNVGDVDTELSGVDELGNEGARLAVSLEIIQKISALQKLVSDNEKEATGNIRDGGNARRAEFQRRKKELENEIDLLKQQQQVIDKLIKSREDEKEITDEEEEKGPKTEEIEARNKIQKLIEKNITDQEKLKALRADFETAKPFLDPKEIERANELFTEMQEKIDASTQKDKVASLKDEFGDLQKMVEDTIEPLSILEADLASLEQIVREGTQEQKDFVFGEGATKEEIEAALKAIRAEIQGIKDDSKEEGLSEQFDHLKSAVESAIDPAVELQKTIDELSSLLNDPSASADVLKFIFGPNYTPEQAQEILAQLREDLEGLKSKGEDVQETFGEAMANAVSASANAFATDFTNALIEGENALESFRDFTKKLVSQIISIFLQMAVINPIINSIFGNVDGFKKLPELAGGGTYQKGQPMIVGERGPELIIPNTGGRVLNNMNTKNAIGAGGGIVINQNLNFSTGVVPTVRTEITKMLPQIAEVSKASVLEATRRGGSFRRGLLNA